MSNQYPIEIDVHAVKALQDSEESFLLLDVRQPEENATAKIAGSTLIPMGELLERIEELAPYQDQRIVVHCHHGGRSMQVTEALRSRGFDKAQNMAGGIDDWSLQINGDIPRY
ncbi:rhodanese-like domain-containing protein [Stieleria sp. TO1_6]|uniref:rhodanese-like domain-containing protein n=1 Tax=Stieleria tagensis TaxID=2956795 RepID=UPI00209ADBD9|nr:rhodanese-like domain-containing protein [Stieleria tagensis]MCO8120276.1 rhodanese-like domain-containing protein [Stieleria tagensis]